MYRGQFLVGLVYGFVLGCWDVYVGCVSEVGDVCVTGGSGCGGMWVKWVMYRWQGEGEKYVNEVGEVSWVMYVLDIHEWSG